MNNNETQEGLDLPLSKTKRKQQAKEIEKLAHQLVELPLPQFKRLPLDEMLAAEVVEARATEGRGSFKRQVKHLAGALREREDLLPGIFAAIEGLDQVRRSDKRQFHKFEELRDRLCSVADFQDAFDEMVGLWPDIDRGVILRLARSVHNSGDKRAFREIFKRMRDHVEQVSGD